MNEAGFMMHNRISQGFAILLLIIGLAICFSIQESARFRIDHPTRITSTGSDPIKFPFLFHEAGSATIQFNFEAKVPGTTHIDIFVDDCLVALEFNGKPYPLSESPRCSYPQRQRYEVGTFIQPGSNTLRAVFENRGGEGYFNMILSPRSMNLLICRGFAVLFGVAIFLIGMSWMSLWKYKELIVVGIFGCALRFAYVAITFSGERDYDSGGHYAYVNFLLTHFQIPSAAAGWQYYQPPLYYALAALWLGFWEYLGFADTVASHLVQGFSLLISCLTLVLVLKMSTRFFPASEQKMERLCFSSLIAFYPGMVMLSSRINPDTLLCCVILFWFSFVLRWWKSGMPADWLKAAETLSFALLVKSTACIGILAMIPISYFRKPLIYKENFARMIAVFGMVLLIAGWLIFYRMVIDHQTHVVGNLDRNGAHLYTQLDSIGSFLSYNPIEVMRQVYADPLRDSSRREYIWEHYVRTSLFSETTSENVYSKDIFWLARSLLFQFHFVLAFAILGICSCMRRPRMDGYAVPCAALFFVTMIAQVGIRASTHIPGFADFRYTVFILPCFAYFALQGILSLRPCLRNIAYMLCFLFTVLCFSWMAALCVLPGSYSPNFWG